MELVMKGDRLLIKEILKEELIQDDAVIKGWVLSIRKSKKFSFIVVTDGSCQKPLQIVADADIENYENIGEVTIGTSIALKGNLVKSQGKGQSIEMQAKNFEIIGKVEEGYPLQKKKTSLEYLREIAHLRPRTNTFRAVFRVRNVLSFATHEFFQKKGYLYLNTPIITGSDAEGAGELFRVTTMDLNNPARTDKGEVDYSKDFFEKPTFLCCTGQLEGEAFALSMGPIYTFGPTFRSENSNTARHLSEFWMVEPEVPFAELDDIANLARDYLKYLISKALEECPDELEFLQKNYKDGLIETLNKVKDSDFIKISYTEAIDILKKSGKKFEIPVEWGDELATEWERYLAEEHFDGPVIVTDYPRGAKAFYMKLNDDDKTVRGMDILVPGVGEIIGGSQREESLDILKTRIKEMGLNEDDYSWYLDLRKYGSVPHGGFGLGFERAVMYVTGMSNIRDVIPFPRTPRNAEF